MEIGRFRKTVRERRSLPEQDRTDRIERTERHLANLSQPEKEEWAEMLRLKVA